MIYTLTLNPSIDYIVGFDSLEIGKVNRTSYEKILPGGKGINVSIVLKNLGTDSCALGFVGGFSGEYIRNAVENSGVKTDFVTLGNGISRINTKIKAEEETEINAKGPDISANEIELLLDKIRKINDGDVLVLAGSVPRGFGKEFYAEIMKELSSRDIKIVVDAEGELLKNTLQYEPFLIKPNNFELEGIFGVEIHSKEETIEYAKKLQKMGAKNVIVSLGGDGGILVSEDGNVFLTEAPKGKVVNTTGCGDSVVAGFVFEFENSKDYEKAFLMGISCGSAGAFSENLAQKEDVFRIYNSLID